MLGRMKEIFMYREMIFRMVRKDLRGRYKGSFLGFFWTFINPLFQIVIYTMVFSIIMRSGIDKFHIFLIVGLIPWIFFSSSVNGGASSVITQPDLVKKIYFPREVLPIAYVTSSFINMLFCFVIIFAALMVSGVGINVLAVLFLPVVMLVEYLLALGIALLFSSLTVYFRDLEHILSIVIMAWMYLTPIMYTVDMVPESIMPVFGLNPVTPIIVAYQDILYFKRIPQVSVLLHAAVLGVIVLFVGSIVFSKLQRNFVEEL